MDEPKLNIEELKRGGYGTPERKGYIFHLGED